MLYDSLTVGGASVGFPGVSPCENDCGWEEGSNALGIAIIGSGETT